MKRLNGGDIQFVYAERAWRPLHTMKVLVVDPGARAAGPEGSALDVETVRRVVHAKLPELEPLRWRLRKVPGRIFHPAWLDGGEVDLNRHVRAVRAPAPGGDAELAEVVSAIASETLDPAHPLWELVVVDGLAGGQVALAWKIHHAICDGTASLNLIRALLDEDPAASVAVAAEPSSRPPLPPEPEPSAPQMVAAAGRDLGELVRTLPSMTARLGRAAANGTRRKKAGGPQPAIAFTGEATRFNRRLDAQRAFSFVTVDLAVVRSVKDALGGTVNDVFLAACAGALRSYLGERGELPERPMSTVVPVTIRQEVADTPWGNFPSNYFVSLATDVADPLERYRAIAASQQAAKAWHDQRDHQLMFDWMAAYPAWAAYTRALPWLVHKLARRPSYSIIASNVRGPERPLHLAGAPMVALHSMGPLVQELGLNITAWSYCDRLSFGFHACRAHVPDLAALAAAVPPALEELATLAGAPSPRTPR